MDLATSIRSPVSSLALEVTRARALVYGIGATISAAVMVITRTPEWVAVFAASLVGVVLVRRGRFSTDIHPLFLYEQLAAVLLSVLGRPLVAVVAVMASVAVSILVTPDGRSRRMVAIGGTSGALVAWLAQSDMGIALAPASVSDPGGLPWRGLAAVVMGLWVAGIGLGFRRLGREMVVRETRTRDAHETQMGVVAASPDPILIHEDGIVVEANDAVRRLLGVAPGDDLTTVVGLRVHPDDRETFSTELLSMAVTPVPVPIRLILGEGRTRHLEFVAIPTQHLGNSAVMLAGRDLTEVMEARQALQTRDELIRLAFAESGVPMAFLDSEGRFVEANDSLRSYLGHDDLIGRDLGQLVEGGWPEALPAERDGSASLDTHLRTSNGAVAYGVVTVSPMSGASGRWFVQIQDVTEEKRALRDLDDRTRELQELFDRLPVALYRSRPTGEVIAANAALARLLGHDDVGPLLGDREAADRAFTDLDDRTAFRERIAAQGVVLDFEYELRRTDGSEIVVSDSAVAVRGPDGNIAYYEGALVDVTSRRTAEESRSRLVAVAEATSDMVGVADDEGNLVYANPTLRIFYGFDPHGPLPHVDARGVLSELEPDQMDEALAALTYTGSWRGELLMCDGDGRQAVVSAVMARHDRPNGAAFYSFVGRDVTEERRTAEQLAQLVRSKDEFIASVSHELRTPLTAVVGLAHELRNAYDLFGEQERKDLVNLISDQSQEVADIVEDLLVAARADTDSIVLVPSEVYVRKAYEAVLGSMPVGTDERVEVRGDAAVHADGRRVRQILRNLLTNALRYGGPRIWMEIRSSGGVVEVEVGDDGEGIDEEMRERVFQPYERAHTVGTQPNSVGLGLSISRWLARKMGGDLVYAYRPGASEFTLVLPSSANR